MADTPPLSAFQSLESEVVALRAENARMASLLESRSTVDSQRQLHLDQQNQGLKQPKTRLDKRSAMRYSRHLLMPEIGVSGQLHLINASALIVGAGGLGAPVSLYLAAAGVGELGIVDYDIVEESNLQRQVIHSESRIGVAKVESARVAVAGLNSHTRVVTHNLLLDSSNAMSVVSNYDLVLDCSDNVATRYLLNDACVLANKPLISGSALRMEGQLTVYNFTDSDGVRGPCYRCIFPVPPPASAVTNCNDGGVLGAVPGTIGTLQALEAIKILAKTGTPLSGRLLLLDGMETVFRTIKLRPRSPKCAVCGDNPTVTALIDYLQFCGSGANDKAKGLSLLNASERITCEEYAGFRHVRKDFVLLDVRPKLQTDICSLEESLLVPGKEIDARLSEIIDRCAGINAENPRDVQIYTLCRRGNQSQVVARKLQGLGFINVKDIVGGVTYWAESVDTEFPIY